MDDNARLFLALFVTLLVGISLVACYLAWTAPLKGECAFCRCPYEAHMWRMGERGQCQRCRVCAWYTADLP